MQSVGNILEHYGSQQKIPLYGFGAKLGGVNSDCFALTGDIFNPEVASIENCLEAYKKGVYKISLEGPAKFGHLLSFVNNFCAS